MKPNNRQSAIANWQLLPLRRLANDHDTAVSSGHRATNHQNIVLGIHARDCEPLNRPAHIAHVTRRASALDDPRRISRSTDRTRRTYIHRTVRLRTTIEMVTLDGTGKATAFRATDHVHHLAIRKLIDQDFVADVRAVAGLRQAKLFQDPRRRNAAAGLLEMPAHRP